MKWVLPLSRDDGLHIQRVLRGAETAVDELTRQCLEGGPVDATFESVRQRVHELKLMVREWDGLFED